MSTETMADALAAPGHMEGFFAARATCVPMAVRYAVGAP